MAIFRKAVLATALVGSGLVGTTGLAMAHDATPDAGQSGLANVDGVQSTVPLNACNNNVPVNVLGVQVPVQDASADVPLLSPTQDGGNGSGVAKTCGNPQSLANG